MHDSRTRRAILRVGKDLRAPFNRVLARYSEVGDPPVFEPALFPWVRSLEAAAPLIKKESEQVLAVRDRLPPISEISPDHKRIAADDRWRSFFLWGYGYRIESNCVHCPETVRLLETIPGLMTAFFSVMLPGTHLPRHKGVSKAIVTCHLPLVVPDDAASCRIDVEGHVHQWAEGDCFVFDDTYPHEVWNDTDQERVVLLLHVKRPVRFPGSLAGDLFLGAVRRSPFIRDARRNQDAWAERLAERDRLAAADGE